MGQGFKSFEDIEAWQLSHKLAAEILVACNSPALHRAFAYKDQIGRAAISIMNNIAEGFGRYSDAEFVRFLRIARASTFEVESMLILGRSVGYLEADKAAEWRVSANLIGRKITALINYLLASRHV
jgi:four helix bundle protein